MKSSSPGRTYVFYLKPASILLSQPLKETRERKRDSVVERDLGTFSKPIMYQVLETTKPNLTLVSSPLKVPKYLRPKETHFRIFVLKKLQALEITKICLKHTVNSNSSPNQLLSSPKPNFKRFCQ